MPKPYPLRRKLAFLAFPFVVLGPVVFMAYYILHSPTPTAPNPKSGQVLELHTKSGDTFYASWTFAIIAYGTPLAVPALFLLWGWYLNKNPYDPGNDEAP
jgi:hypothetical protein